MRNTLATLFILLSFGLTAQVSVYNQTGEKLDHFDTLNNIQPVVQFEAVDGFLFWFDASLMNSMTGVPEAYSHSPMTNTGEVNFKSIGRQLSIDKQYCFLFVRGTNYNMVASYWTDSAALFVPAFSPETFDCSMKPDWEIEYMGPTGATSHMYRFTYEEQYAESLGEGWTLRVTEPGNTYKTPRTSGKVITTTGSLLTVGFRLLTGQNCPLDSMILPTLRLSNLADLLNPGSIITGLDGTSYIYKEAPTGMYVFNRELIYKN